MVALLQTVVTMVLETTSNVNLIETKQTLHQACDLFFSGGKVYTAAQKRSDVDLVNSSLLLFFSGSKSLIRLKTLEKLEASIFLDKAIKTITLSMSITAFYTNFLKLLAKILQQRGKSGPSGVQLQPDPLEGFGKHEGAHTL